MEYIDVSAMVTSMRNLMNYFSNFSNYCMENKNRVFIFLIFFHILCTLSLFILANTEYLSSLHFNTHTTNIWTDYRVKADIDYTHAIFWKFAADSFIYHIEAINAVDYIEKSLWVDWLEMYPHHQHVKLISILYWITGYHSPLVYAILIGSVVWATSFMLIYRSSEMLFPDSNKVPLITSLFCFQPSLLVHSTQLLRDPLYLLGFCLVCYGMILVFKQKTKWKWIFIINAGFFIMIAMRNYLLPIFLMTTILFSVLAFFQKRSSFLPLLFLIVPLILIQSVSDNRYMSLSVFSKDNIIDQSNYISTHSLPVKTSK